MFFGNQDFIRGRLASGDRQKKIHRPPLISEVVTISCYKIQVREIKHEFFPIKIWDNNLDFIVDFESANSEDLG
jgi:hypothetical protein